MRCLSSFWICRSSRMFTNTRLTLPMLQVYKVERDANGHPDLLPRLPPGLQTSGHPEPFSVSPRGQSSAGSCGTPDPRTPLTPRPASQQERWVGIIKFIKM